MRDSRIPARSRRRQSEECDDKHRKELVVRSLPEMLKMQSYPRPKTAQGRKHHCCQDKSIVSFIPETESGESSEHGKRLSAVNDALADNYRSPIVSPASPCRRSGDTERKAAKNDSSRFWHGCSVHREVQRCPKTRDRSV